MDSPVSSEQAAKDAAARHAAHLVEDGMVVGLGTGSTAVPFVRALGERARAGLSLTAIPTSESTARLAVAEGLRLATLEEYPHLDMDIDGADAIDPHMNLIKGLGGALLREKIVAFAAERFVVIAHWAKLVDTLAVAPVVPVEVVTFGWSRTRHELEELCATVTRRVSHVDPGQPFITDGGNYIFDCHFADLADPPAVAGRVKSLVGVVEHGLFIDMASEIVIGRQDGTVQVLTA